MKTETNDTPRTDEACEAMGLKAFVVPVETSRQLERELAEKTNEVARLRELLNRAIEIADGLVDPFTRITGVPEQELAKLKASVALAPSPEEPVSDKNTELNTDKNTEQPEQ